MMFLKYNQLELIHFREVDTKTNYLSIYPQISGRYNA